MSFLHYNNYCQLQHFSYPNYDEYCSTYQRQKFSFPDSITYYLTKNPSTSNVYQKLIKSCKHFFINNPILVVNTLTYNAQRWKAYFKHNEKRINLNKFLCKIWITDSLDIQTYVYLPKAGLELLPKLFRCDASWLIFEKQIISMKDLLLLTKKATKLNLKWTIIKNEDGSKSSFEKLIENVPLVTCFECNFETSSYSISQNTVKELLSLPNFKQLRFIKLLNITEEFDIETFFKFLKDNRGTRSTLVYITELSEPYKNKLNSIVDEIISKTSFNYIPPMIFYLDMSHKRFDGMRYLFFNLQVFC